MAGDLVNTGASVPAAGAGERLPVERTDPTRVAIVGAGNVGASFAYALLLSGLASEIVLIDVNRERAEGEAMDLNHTVPFAHPARVWAGDYDDCAGAAVTVITAGANQRPGETRLQLVAKNATIFRGLIPEVAAANPAGIILVATNPVDVLTHTALRASGLPPDRVIGSGTTLDTARFRYLISRRFGVDARSVHAYIIGEHGDSEVPVWSLANIAGMRLADYCEANGATLDEPTRQALYQETRDAAYEIIRRKGATYYAIGAGLVRIVEAILRNQRTVLTVSSLVDGYCGISDVALSLPTIIDRQGVQQVIRLRLNEQEEAGLHRSADVLHEHIRSISARA
jgi:L-lactate dehydrogenase